jgi:hypothetical protein
MITKMINMPIKCLKREICEIKIKIGILKKQSGIDIKMVMASGKETPN